LFDGTFYESDNAALKKKKNLKNNFFLSISDGIPVVSVLFPAGRFFGIKVFVP
jgi:hypothetical protein